MWSIWRWIPVSNSKNKAKPTSGDDSGSPLLLLPEWLLPGLGGVNLRGRTGLEYVSSALIFAFHSSEIFVLYWNFCLFFKGPYEIIIGQDQSAVSSGIDTYSKISAAKGTYFLKIFARLFFNRIAPLGALITCIFLVNFTKFQLYSPM